MTRLFGESIPIEVGLFNAAAPQEFTWKKRKHQVKKVANHWRIDYLWWRDPIWRDYFRVETTSGLMLTIYQDLITDLWYLQISYD
ncbi:MAG: hypothetical protein H0X30_00850 [Anaerolineae bacterium]|nr:hypothetical protein [Anaerolineae bacterium]